MLPGNGGAVPFSLFSASMRSSGPSIVVDYYRLRYLVLRDNGDGLVTFGVRRPDYVYPRLQR
jgi:hypothetical protein